MDVEDNKSDHYVRLNHEDLNGIEANREED